MFFSMLTSSLFYIIMNKIKRYSVEGDCMPNNQVHNEIKAIIAHSGLTLTEVVNRMNQVRAPEDKTTVQNISNKLARGTIKFSEVFEIAAVIGLKIRWDKV